MEAWNAIRSRRNVRRFAERAMDPADLDRILEAGRRTPSSRNQQRWHFVVRADHDQVVHRDRW